MEAGKHIAFNDKAKRELENELDKLKMMKSKFTRQQKEFDASQRS